uniref:Uncharacterized protein n=1 Tax=Anguilla anguilla TaxID=7936 RepID=A0A0E9XWU1_ANGAN
MMITAAARTAPEPPSPSLFARTPRRSALSAPSGAGRELSGSPR